MTPEQLNGTLRLPAGDSNYASGLAKMTDQELLYCWVREHRKIGLQQIRQEMRRREKEAQKVG